MEKRNCEKFLVKKANTERYRKSAIPSMQRLLNQSEREMSDILKRINDTVPVNNDCSIPITVKKNLHNNNDIQIGNIKFLHQEKRRSMYVHINL